MLSRTGLFAADCGPCRRKPAGRRRRRPAGEEIPQEEGSI